MDDLASWRISGPFNGLPLLSRADFPPVTLPPAALKLRAWIEAVAGRSNMVLRLEIVEQFEMRFTIEQFEVTVEQFVEIEQFEMSVQQFERAEQIEMAKQSVVRAATRAAAEIFSCAFGGTSVKSRSCAFGGGISFPPDGCMRAHRAEV